MMRTTNRTIGTFAVVFVLASAAVPPVRAGWSQTESGVPGGLGALAGPPTVSINEVRIEHPGGSNDDAQEQEYFELYGKPGTDLSGLTYIVIGGSIADTGIIEAVVDVGNYTLDHRGFFLVGETTFTLGVPDLVTDLDFRDHHNVTHALVRDFDGFAGQDLDRDDDGVLDLPLPWTEVVDLIAFLGSRTPGSSTNYAYGPPFAGPEDGLYVPAHVFARPDGSDTYAVGYRRLDLSLDTPGRANWDQADPCEPEQVAGSNTFGRRHLWSHSFGEQAGKGNGETTAVDADGNIVVAGFFHGTVDFGGVPLAAALEYYDIHPDIFVNPDMFVAKFDPTGRHLWSRRFGDGRSQKATAVATDSAGNIVVTGLYEGWLDFGGGPLMSARDHDAFVVKLDPGGRHIWSKRIGGPGEPYPSAVAVDPAGNVVVTGDFGGTVEFGGEPLTSASRSDLDVFVARFDPAGNHLWSRRFGGAGRQEATSLAVDPEGNAFVTGFFEETIHFGCDALVSVGFQDGFIAKLSAGGSCAWSMRFGGDEVEDVRSARSAAQSTATVTSGDVVVAGTFSGSMDLGGGPLGGDGGTFVAKLDGDGNHIWSIDGSGAVPFGLSVDPIGHVVVTGRSFGTVDFGGEPLVSAGGGDVFLARFDSGGRLLWSERFGDADSQWSSDVATDDWGNAVATGTLFGNVDFGSGPLDGGRSPSIFVAKFGSDGDHVWSKRFGGGDPSASEGTGIAVDGDENAFVIGRFRGTADFGGGPLVSDFPRSHDLFLVKFDAAGNHLWSNRLGRGSHASTATDAGGNVLLAGDFHQVDFTNSVAKLDPWGNQVWSMPFGGGGNRATSIATDASGNVVVGGYFQNSVHFGGRRFSSLGGEDMFVAMFDPSGNHLWSKQFGDAASYQQVLALATDPSGNVVVTGRFQGTVDFGGERLVNVNGVPLGRTDDIFVAKFDGLGNHLWSHRFGDTLDQVATAVATDESGNVFLTGNFWGTLELGGEPLVSAGGDDIFIAKFDPTGTHLWSHGFGNACDQAATGIATDAAGNVIITGDFKGAMDLGGGLLVNAGDTDLFLASFDPEGNHLLSQRFGDPRVQRGSDVAIDASGNVLVTGSIAGTVDFGDGPIANGGVSPFVFISKFRGSPEVAAALQAFDSLWLEDHVEVTWWLHGVEGELDFVVSRAAPESEYERIAAPEIRRNGDAFVFEDSSPTLGESYRYRVVVLEDGKAVTSFETEVTIPGGRFALRQNHPNPFNPTTAIQFEVPASGGHVALRIYDLRGRLVRTLVDGVESPGMKTAVWDGRNGRGEAVASGIYLYELVAPRFNQTKKMTMLQ